MILDDEIQGTVLLETTAYAPETVRKVRDERKVRDDGLEVAGGEAWRVRLFKSAFSDVLRLIERSAADSPVSLGGRFIAVS